jgi:ribose transport system ATP-binding protein
MSIVDTSTTAEEPDPVLEIRDLSKSFLANQALSSFSLSLHRGQIHALVGANGSGKSTLIKVLSGFYLPDAGSVRVDGSELVFGVAESSYKLGCRFVHQDLALVDSVSVADNLHLSTVFPTRLGTIRRHELRSSAVSVLDQVGLSDVDPRQTVGELSAAERTGVAVARALQSDREHPPKVLVLDEPTATLPIEEVDHLLTMLMTAAQRGLGVLYVTHHLEEVYRISDWVTVLRDGRVVGQARTADMDRETLVALLGGAEVGETGAEVAAEARPGDASRLQVRDLWEGPLRGVSLSASGGEVLGIAGLTGSGREAILGNIFGVYPRSKGTVELGEAGVPGGRPDLAISAGIAYLPADRKTSGGMMTLSAQDNLTVADLRPFWSRLRLSRAAQAREARKWFGRLDVRPSSAVRQPLERFSGGNQQKILLAKWLRLEPRVLLLDEPTQGVDVGAKGEIHRHILDAAKRGAIVLVSSTDVEELLFLCSRIIVLRNGRIFDELSGARLNESEIMRSFLSHIGTQDSDDRTRA